MGNQQSNKRKENAKQTNNSHRAKKCKKKNKKNSILTDGIAGIPSNPVVIGGPPAPPGDKFPVDQKLNLKIYPSYTSGKNELTCLEDGNPDDVRVYRHNKDRLHQRKSATVPAFHSSTIRDYPELGRRCLRWDSLSETRSSNPRASNTSTPTNTGRKVAKEDFPSSIAVRQRSNHFEHTFIESLTQKFVAMPCKVQLASLSIAIRPFTAHQAVSLFSYLKSHTVPIDLRPTVSGRELPEYILTIPTALFLDIKRIREERISDPDVLASAARDIVTCIVGEVANEISRMFEYQIALLNEETSVSLLAEHAADCVIEYAVKRSHRLLDRNTVIQGVVRGQPKTGKARFISVIVGSQELKWDLNKILKKPGLRKDVLLFAEGLNKSNGRGWTFHSSEDCDPLLYGYRGLMIEWDFQNEVYRISGQEQRLLIADEMVWRPDDFHRLYTPYQCLVGAAVMTSCKTVNLGAGDDETLAEYMLSLLGSANNCGEIQPVYRPLSRRCIRMAAIRKTSSLNQAKEDINRMSLCLTSASVCNDSGPKDLPNGIRRVHPSTQRFIKEDTVRTNRLPVRQNICTAAAEDKEEEEKREEEEEEAGTPSVAMTMAPDIQDIDDGESAVVEQMVTMTSSEGSHHQLQMLGNCERKEREKPWTVEDIVINKDDFKSKEMKDDKDNKKKRTEEKWNRKTLIQAENENKVKKREEKSRKNSDDRTEEEVWKTAEAMDKSSTVDPFPLMDQCPGGQQRISNQTPFVENADPNSGPLTANHLSSNKKTEDMLRGWSIDSGGGDGEKPVRKAALYVEMKENIRCKILQALEVLRVEAIPSQLPEAKLFGRKTQVCHLTEMLTPAGSMVTITGCYGIGKSAVVLAIGHNIKMKSITSVFINCRGCCSMASLVRRLVGHFGLRFRLDELTYFYNWLNCHDQQLLLILDNVDLPEEDNEALSYVTDDLLHAVPKLRIVCTRIHPFYQGKVSSGRRTYRLGDIRETSDSLFLQVAPDLRDKDIQMLSSLCCYIPFAIQLIGNVLAFEEDMDPRSLVQSLSSTSHPALPSLDSDIRELTRDECERKQLRCLTICILAVLDNIGEIYTEILCKMSCFVSGFDDNEAMEAVHKSHLVIDALRTLSKLGLLIHDSKDGRYHLPPAVRLVCRNLMVDDGVIEALYCIRILEKLKDACDQYGSSDHQVAMATVERDYDNITDSLRRVTESESVYEAAWSLASLDGAIFLSEFLSEDVYCCFFEMLERAADGSDDLSRRCQALCCLAFYHTTQGKVGHAAFAASKAYEISGSVGEVDKAFCFYCLAKVYWYDEEEQRKALMLAKRAVDLFQELTGPLDIRTLYACELYGWMLTSAGHLQTARHVYNIADEAAAVVDGHPQMLAGYGCRRLIWDELGLFERAKQMAVKANRLTQWMYGEHPATGTALMQLCEATVKRGSLSDAICLSIHALAIRIKVLGPSFDTGLTYKMLSSLMLRQTQYEGAAAFGQRALEIFERTGSADGDLIVDVKDIINQSRLKMARSRQQQQQQQHSKMLQVEAATTKELANKKNVTFQELVRSTEWPLSKSSAEV